MKFAVRPFCVINRSKVTIKSRTAACVHALNVCCQLTWSYVLHRALHNSRRSEKLPRGNATWKLLWFLIVAHRRIHYAPLSFFFPFPFFFFSFLIKFNYTDCYAHSSVSPSGREGLDIKEVSNELRKGRESFDKTGYSPGWASRAIKFARERRIKVRSFVPSRW